MVTCTVFMRTKILVIILFTFPGLLSVTNGNWALLRGLSVSSQTLFERENSNITDLTDS